MENQPVQKTAASSEQETSSFGQHPLENGFSTSPNGEGNSRSSVPFGLTATPLGEGVASSGRETVTLTASGGSSAAPLSFSSQGPIQNKQAPLQRQQIPPTTPAPSSEPHAVFRITVTRRMSGEEFKAAAMMQVFGRIISDVTWINIASEYTPERSPYDLQVAMSLIRIYRSQTTQERGIPTESSGDVSGSERRAQEFNRMPQGGTRQALLDEIDRRYYATTGARPGTLIREGEEGNSQLWRSIRDEVLYQHQHLRDLPEAVRLLIRRSTNGRPMTPADYERLFQIARRIENMTPEQILDYASRVNGSTTNLDEFEASLNNYIRQRAERQQSTQAREAVQTRLFGLEEVYNRYLEYKSMLMTEAMAAGMGGGPMPFVESVSTRMGRELTTQLQAHGFESITAFEQFIRQFEQSFELESANVFDDTLARYHGTLYRESQRYQNPAELTAMQQLLIASSPDLANRHPIFHDEGLPDDRRIPRQTWARASQGQLGGLVQAYIRMRIADVSEARGRVSGDHRLIYKMDRMFPLFYQMQNIAPDSIYDRIIREKMRNDAIVNLVLGIVGAIAAIALTVVSLGTATPAVVAAMAGAGAFGLSTYFAIEEYQRYTTENNLANVGVMDDPSIIWLTLAILGAALDMGAAARAIRALSPAARALNSTGDIEAFNRALRALQEAGEVEGRIAQAAQRAAAARQGFREATGELGRVLRSRVYSFPGPFTDPDVYRVLVQMAGAKIRQGVAVFQEFVLELRRARLAEGLAEMSPQELAKVKEAWEQALVIARSAQTPVDIMSDGANGGRVIGRFSNGSHLEIISRSSGELYGGNRIGLAADRTTTVTGTLADVNTVATRGGRLPGVTAMGSNPGAINILRSPRWAAIQEAHRPILEAGETARYWRTVTDEFWNTVNRPWLDEAIARGDQFRFVSNPADDAATFVTNGRGVFQLDEAGQRIRSIFGREVDYLRSRGYRFLPDGTAVPAPR